MMSLHFVLLYFTSIVYISIQAQLPLSNRINELKAKKAFGWNYPFQLLENLPNPHHIGYEKQKSEKDEFQPQKDCDYQHKNLTAGSSNTITSPNYPSNYPPGVKCQWTLQSEPGTAIRVTLFDVVTQPWFLFFYDYLAISPEGNWSKFYRLTGDMNRIAPITLESTDNKIGIRFESSYDFLNYRGFKMAYIVTRRAISDEHVTTNSTSADPPVDYGNNTDVSALCDYVPITLPPESNGEDPEKKYVRASEATPNEFPFAVAMVMDDSNFCSGSLIDEYHVLTAAHCVNGSQKVAMYFGVHDMRNEELDSRQYQLVPSTTVVQHPNYDPVTAANDIAIVKLNRRIKTTAFVQPIYLPSIYSMGNTFQGWKLTTMGWGQSNKSSTDIKISPVLQKTSSTVIPNEECRKTYRSLVTGNMLCTSAPTESGCYGGDSGTPLVAKFVRTQNIGEEVSPVVNDDNQSNQCYFRKSHRDRHKQEKGRPGQPGVSDWFVQLGVLSFGSRTCGSAYPTAFTRTTAYLDFINEVVYKQIVAK